MIWGPECRALDLHVLEEKISPDSDDARPRLKLRNVALIAIGLSGDSNVFHILEVLERFMVIMTCGCTGATEKHLSK